MNDFRGKQKDEVYRQNLVWGGELLLCCLLTGITTTVVVLMYHLAIKLEMETNSREDS